ncbi:MAG TPA: outer membrane beta-barrel protein [Thermoanaerobaculia bacterium]|nr:outer membrane beta-barrel protein [Thermoanaerobaculia bacterium]
MRKPMLVLLVLLVAVPALAQSLDRPNRVSVFLSNVSGGWSEGGGSFFDAGYGVAYERRFTRTWSGELAVTVQEQENARSYPFDLAARYTFPSVHTRWRPYAGAGVRFVSAPGPEPRGELWDNQIAPEVVAGVDFNAAEAWSLRVDAKHTFGNTYADDDPFKLSVGVGWRF